MKPLVIVILFGSFSCVFGDVDEPVSETVGRGDLNGDGQLTNSDCQAMQAFLAGTRSLIAPLQMVDVDKNGRLTSGDLMELCQRVGARPERTRVAGTRGDVDSNGRITVADLIALSEYFSGKRKWLPCLEQAADVDGNGRVTINDLIELRIGLFG